MVKIVAENFRNLIKSVGGNKFGAGVLYLATHTRMALTLKTQNISFLKTSMLILLYFIIPFLLHIAYL